MQVLNFPGCCTAKVIVGFGEEHAASYRADRDYTDRSMAQELDRLIRGPQIGTNMGSIVVQLTSRQQRGIRVLTALGFTSTVAQPKNNHSDTSLYTFTHNPRLYIQANRSIDELFPAPAGQPAEPKLLVKTLRPEWRTAYRRYRDYANQHRVGSHFYERYMEMAMDVKNNPAYHNFS